MHKFLIPTDVHHPCFPILTVSLSLSLSFDGDKKTVFFFDRRKQQSTKV